MAKYQTQTFLGIKNVPQPDDAFVKAVSVDVEFPSVAPIANDLIELVKLPAGTKCLDFTLIFPDIDSNGSPALAYSLGVENAGGTDLGTEVWATGLTAGQSTTLHRCANSVPADGDSTVERKLALKVTTAAATYAGAGKVGRFVMLLQG